MTEPFTEAVSNSWAQIELNCTKSWSICLLVFHLMDVPFLHAFIEKPVIARVISRQ